MPRLLEPHNRSTDYNGTDIYNTNITQRNTKKVQKHHSRKHHALHKFVGSLPHKIEKPKKRFGDQTNDTH